MHVDPCVGPVDHGFRVARLGIFRGGRIECVCFEIVFRPPSSSDTPPCEQAALLRRERCRADRYP